MHVSCTSIYPRLPFKIVECEGEPCDSVCKVNRWFTEFSDSVRFPTIFQYIKNLDRFSLTNLLIVLFTCSQTKLSYTQTQQLKMYLDT